MKKMLFITLFFLAVPSFFILKIYKEPELKKEINIINNESEISYTEDKTKKMFTYGAKLSKK